MRIFNTSAWNSYPHWCYDESTHQAFWANKQNQFEEKSGYTIEAVLGFCKIRGGEEIETLPLELQVDEGL